MAPKQPKPSFFMRNCPSCHKDVPVFSPATQYCRLCKNYMGPANMNELTPTPFGIDILKFLTPNIETLTEAGVKSIKKNIPDDKKWLFDLFSPVIDIAMEVIPQLVERDNSPPTLEQILTPQDRLYMSMGIPPQEWHTPAGSYLSHTKLKEPTQRRGKYLMTEHVGDDGEELTQFEEKSKTIEESELEQTEAPEVPKDFNLINQYLKDLTPDALKEYISGNLNLALLMKPYLSQLTKKQKIIIRLASYTSIKIYLSKEGKHDLITILETDKSKKWVKSNLKKIRALIKKDV